MGKGAIGGDDGGERVLHKKGKFLLAIITLICIIYVHPYYLHRKFY